MATFPYLTGNFQIPSAPNVPKADFSGFEQLGKGLEQQALGRSLADLPKMADGTPDYTAAAQKAYTSGNVPLGLKFAELGQAQAQRVAGQKAVNDLFGGGQPSGGLPAPPPTNTSGTGADPRGIRNNNPLNIEAGNFTQGQPGYAGSDGRFARFGGMEQGIEAAGNLLDSYARRGFNTVSKIIGRWAPASDGNNVNAYVSSVARAVGVDPNAPLDLSNPQVKRSLVMAMGQHENGRPIPMGATPAAGITGAAAPQPGAQVAQAPQAAPTQPPTQPAQLLPNVTTDQLIRAVVDPRIDAGAKAGLKLVLDQRIDAMKIPDVQKNYLKAKSEGFRGNFVEYQQTLKPSTNVNIDNKTQAAGDQAAEKVIVERLDNVSKEGDSAREDMVAIGQLRELTGQFETGGAAAVKGYLAQYGVKLGPEVPAIEAFGSLIDRLTPKQRVPGSGATSDMEMRTFKSALPNLIRTPEGNAIIIDTMEAIARDKQARADIANKALVGEISRKDALKQMTSLPDPLATFKEYQKANKQPGTPQAAPRQAAPQQGAARPPVQGARQAGDGKWYVSDPNRPGKYLEVRP